MQSTQLSLNIQRFRDFLFLLSSRDGKRPCRHERSEKIKPNEWTHKMSVQRRKSYVLQHLVQYLNFSSSLQPACPCFCREGTDSDKGGFPLSHNFYVRTHLNFTRVNKIETMYERSRVNVKVEPRSTFTIYAWPFIHYLYVIYARKFYVRLHGKITRQS